VATAEGDESKQAAMMEDTTAEAAVAVVEEQVRITKELNLRVDFVAFLIVTRRRSHARTLHAQLSQLALGRLTACRWTCCLCLAVQLSTVVPAHTHEEIVARRTSDSGRQYNTARWQESLLLLGWLSCADATFFLVQHPSPAFVQQAQTSRDRAKANRMVSEWHSEANARTEKQCSVNEFDSVLDLYSYSLSRCMLRLLLYVRIAICRMSWCHRLRLQVVHLVAVPLQRS
jgi:hypothetical protein